MNKFKSFFSSIKEPQIKIFCIVSLLVFCFFIAFNYYPLTFGFWETAEIYKNFLPTKKPWIIFSIPEDPVLFGPFNTFGYAGLAVSRYISDYLGHSVSNIRLPSIIYGLISLLLFYVILNRWFNWKVAFISTFILSTNHYFFIFQHFLLSPMITLTTILFCIERFQNLLKRNTNFSIITFGFACALACLNYWTSRWCMLGILFFYVIDFEKFSSINLKSYYFFTNQKRLKNFFLVITSMVFFLILLFPGNLFLLFTTDFIYPSLRIGEFSDDANKTFYNFFHNIKYYLTFFIFNISNHASDLLVYVPRQIENVIILFFTLIGIVICILKKNVYSFFFVFFIFIITLVPPFISETSNTINFESSTSLTIHRVFFTIPFICLIAVLGFYEVFNLIFKINNISKIIFPLLIIIFFIFRSYSFFIELNESKNLTNSYNYEFTSPANSEGIKKVIDVNHNTQREYHYNQTYFFKLAQHISQKLESTKNESNKKNFIYISAEMFTPFKYSTGGGLVPFKGHPYYFPMFLTFYLQELGLNVSYLVKSNETKESFFRKAINVINRFDENKHLPNEILFSKDIYPRNEKQLMILKFSNKIVRTLDNYKFGQNILNFMKNDEINTGNQIIVNEYLINKTSRKKPDYIIIVNKEQLDAIKDHNEYKLVLSMPSL